MVRLRRGDHRAAHADRVDRHGCAGRDHRSFACHCQRHADRVSSAEHQRHRRLGHPRNHLRDRKPGLHVPAHGVEQEQHAFDLLAGFQACQQRQDVLIFRCLAVWRQEHVPFHLTHDGQAVDRTPRGMHSRGSQIYDGLHRPVVSLLPFGILFGDPGFLRHGRPPVK